jgi:hypothetical protein
MLVELKTRSEKILYVWDYFYISHVAATGDEAPWLAIERATSRIRMSEVDISVSTPVDIRFRAARRMRDAARLALRQIERLVTKPEQWVIDALVDIEAFAAELVETLFEPARQAIVH